MLITAALKKASPWLIIVVLTIVLLMAMVLTMNPGKEFSCSIKSENKWIGCSFSQKNYSHVEELDSFPKVILGASNLILTADQEVFIAVDVAAYGGHSHKTEFDFYKNSLKSFVSQGKKLNTILLPRIVEYEYVSSLLNDDATKEFMEKSELIREIIKDENTKEYPLPQVAAMQFWVTKNSKGEFNSIIAWTVGEGSGSVRGVHTRSQGVGQVLMMVWQRWNNRGSMKLTNDLIRIISEHQM